MDRCGVRPVQSCPRRPWIQLRWSLSNLHTIGSFPSLASVFRSVVDTDNAALLVAEGLLDHILIPPVLPQLSRSRASPIVNGDRVHVERQPFQGPIKGKQGEERERVVFLSMQVADMFRELKVFAGGPELVLPGSLIRPFAKNPLNKASDDFLRSMRRRI
jgi:hypothetical protein